MMPEHFELYHRRFHPAELKRWTPETDMSGVSVSLEDEKAGSPKDGDMIARNPTNHADQWLVSKKYFEENFEPESLGPVVSS